MLFSKLKRRLNLPSQNLGGQIEFTGLSGQHFGGYTEEGGTALVLGLQCNPKMLKFL